MALSEEQKGFLFLVLKAAIDVLDQSGIELTLQGKEMDRIKNKWDFLIQCRPNVKGMIGNAKLVGGHIDYNDNHEQLFNFITSKGMFSYNERTDEFKSKLQIR